MQILLCKKRCYLLSLVLCCTADNNKKRRLCEPENDRMFLLLVLASDTAPSHHTFPIRSRKLAQFWVCFLILNENCKCKVFLLSLEYIPHFPQLVPKCKSNILEKLSPAYPVSSVLY